MGIFDRFRAKPHETASPGERAALAHDEAADAFTDPTGRSGPEASPAPQSVQLDEDHRAAADMTAEGDPWD
ncbi:hypothetical protein KNE206_29190 [Kitasatospora sp. NE20-6]|uniref:hypothetical protein n=1 Tax=Kitasatospora sp. NE20-6 TaxID=2859066 RepID=UPI0034DBF327